MSSTIKSPVIKRLWNANNGKCAFENGACRESVLDTKSGRIIAEMAHIAGEKEGSARYDSSQKDSERNAFDNLLLLCPNHHKKIDSKEERSTFTLQELLKWKAASELEPSGVVLNDSQVDEVRRINLAASAVGEHAMALVANQEAGAVGSVSQIVNQITCGLEVKTAIDLIDSQVSPVKSDIKRLEKKFRKVKTALDQVPNLLLNSGVIEKRVGVFEDHLARLIASDDKVNKLIDASSEPSFMRLLQKARVEASCSVHETNVELLASLISHRLEGAESDSKHNRSANAAVEAMEYLGPSEIDMLAIATYLSNIVCGGHLHSGIIIHCRETLLPLIKNTSDLSKRWEVDLEAHGLIKVNPRVGSRPYGIYESLSKKDWMFTKGIDQSTRDSLLSEFDKKTIDSLLEEVNPDMPEYILHGSSKEQFLNHAKECKKIDQETAEKLLSAVGYQAILPDASRAKKELPELEEADLIFNKLGSYSLTSAGFLIGYTRLSSLVQLPNMSDEL